MNVHVRQLSRLERAPLERHFLALGSEDRRLRFGIGVNDFAVRTYVKRIDFESDAVFGVLDDELQLANRADFGSGFHFLAGQRITTPNSPWVRTHPTINAPGFLPTNS